MIIIDQEDKLFSMFCHLSALLGYFLPFGNIIGPLIIWFIKKDVSEIVNHQGKEAINFQLTVTVGVLISIPLCFILIGFIFLIGLAIFDIVFIIIAAVKSYDGHQYEYPLSFKFLK